MPVLSRHKKLFQLPDTRDKLTLFQILLDAKMLAPDMSLALLKIIHRELIFEKQYDFDIYKNYAASISALRYYAPDIFAYVVKEWRSGERDGA